MTIGRSTLSEGELGTFSRNRQVDGEGAYLPLKRCARAGPAAALVVAPVERLVGARHRDPQPGEPFTLDGWCPPRSQRATMHLCCTLLVDRLR